MSTVLTRTVARLLLAPIATVGVAFLVNGYAGAGDGFAAGAIVALGFLLQYLAFGVDEAERWLPLRHAPRASLVGLGIVLAVAVQSLLLGEEILSHAPEGDPTRFGRLELTTALAFDVGIFLLVLGAVVTAVHAVARSARGDTR